MTADNRQGPLAGLLVADLSRVLAGPYATQILGDLGADVIKVEAPRGDETRQWTPRTDDGLSTYFLGINRNKRSVVLDFTESEDLRLAQELCRRADIVVENFRAGGLAKYGLDYASIHSTNPGVIYASITGFGEAGGAHLPGYDLTVQAMSGLMSLTGAADGPGFRSAVSVCDITTALQTVVGILAALHHRTATGEGQRVQVNLLMSMLSALSNHASAYLNTGTVPHRQGNAHPAFYPYDPFPCADGELIIATATDDQFRALADAIGRADLADDVRFRTVADRHRNRTDLHPHLVDALSTKTVDEWFQVLTAQGIACGPINTLAEGIALAADLGLDPVVDLDVDLDVGEDVGQDVGNGAVRSLRNPITFSATPAGYRSGPPALGEHSADLRTWLSTG
jgi:crotonobetainyl-CoA:carnitine CoA-transferase CaiB-like acyl-CoA transferase